MGNYRFPPSFIQELLSRVDIVEIISNYLSLKQVGRNFVALCPFHPEKTPSFVVSPEKQIFKCFGCGVGGNAITFVEKYENLSFYEAVKRVAELSGIEIPAEFKESDSVSKLEEEGFKVAKFFNSQVELIKDYLEKRDISSLSVERFLLGYAPKGYLKKLKVSKEVLKELGVITENGKEFFSNRLIIPIFNHSGKVVAFAGRVLEENSNLPKYINSPETSIFKKGSTLYGFYQARDSILKERKALIVEGYFDVISLHDLGFKTAVAPMGTSLTENHVSFISRYVDKPILAFDGDKAGVKATLRAGGLFLKKGKEPFVVVFPEGEDPDSMAKKSSHEMNTLLSSPLPFVEWIIFHAKKLKEIERGEFLKEFAVNLAPLKLENPFLYKTYVNRVSAHFDVDPSWFKSVTGSYRRFNDEEVSYELIPPTEKAFLKGLMENSLELPLEISPNVFHSQLAARIFTLLTNSEESPLSLQSEFPELSSVISEILLTDFSEEEIKNAFCRMAAKEIERRLRKTKDLKEKKQLKRLAIELFNKKVEVLKELSNKTPI